MNGSGGHKRYEIVRNRCVCADFVIESNKLFHGLFFYVLFLIFRINSGSIRGELPL